MNRKEFLEILRSQLAGQMQEGKAAGLGAISGAAETYWGKNKGRSMEGTLVKITKYLAISFIVIAAILNISKF